MFGYYYIYKLMLNKKEFKDIYIKHFDSTRKFVFDRCGDKEMASDVAQDVFMKLWEKRSVLKGQDITFFLYKITNDCYIDNYRRKICFMNLEQSITTTDCDPFSPDEEMIFNELADSYAKALEQMTEKQRTVFLMSRDDGMKYAEIAGKLRISVKSVEKHISDALRFLRKKLL